MEDTDQASQPSSSPSSPAATAVPLSFSMDLIARATAPVLLTVYGLGFVILGFHDARYGVVQFSPFRARIVLVGFVFLALVSLTAAAQHYGLSYFGPLEPVIKDRDPKRRVQRDIVLGAGFIFTAALISSTLGSFLFFSSAEQKVTGPGWQVLAGALIYFSAMGVFTLAAKTYLRKPGLATFLSLLAFAMVVSSYFWPRFWPTRSAYLTLMLTLVGWHTIVVKSWETAAPFAYRTCLGGSRLGTVEAASSRNSTAAICFEMSTTPLLFQTSSFSSNM
jgi:hypothetical protein